MITVAGGDMIDSSLILDRHPVCLRGNFAIHHPGEFTAKFKPFRLYHIAPFACLNLIYCRKLVSHVGLDPALCKVNVFNCRSNTFHYVKIERVFTPGERWAEIVRFRYYKACFYLLVNGCFTLVKRIRQAGNRGSWNKACKLW